MKQPPIAVQKYIAEFDETEAGVRQYIFAQLQYYSEIPDKATSTPEQWLGFKMGCSSRSAATAIKWAKTDRPKRP